MRSFIPQNKPTEGEDAEVQFGQEVAAMTAAQRIAFEQTVSTSSPKTATVVSHAKACAGEPSIKLAKPLLVKPVQDEVRQ